MQGDLRPALDTAILLMGLSLASLFFEAHRKNRYAEEQSIYNREFSDITAHYYRETA